MAWGIIAWVELLRKRVEKEAVKLEDFIGVRK